VVGSLVVPALVGVLGRWNWWLPTWLARPLRVPPSPLRPHETSTLPSQQRVLKPVGQQHRAVSLVG
jgi:RND superfamily putative drug exporter